MWVIDTLHSWGASVLGVLSESSSKDGCGDRGKLFTPGEGVGEGASSTQGEDCDDASSSSMQGEGVKFICDLRLKWYD